MSYEVKDDGQVIDTNPVELDDLRAQRDSLQDFIAAETARRNAFDADSDAKITAWQVELSALVPVIEEAEEKIALAEETP